MPLIRSLASIYCILLAIFIFLNGKIISLRYSVTDLINRIVQVLKGDLYWVRISVQNAELMEPVKL